MDPKRFTFVDGLRGIASLAVVLFHAVEGNHVASLPEFVRNFASWGHIGVPAFFVLSGFVIAHSLRNERMTLRQVGRFVGRRSVRLDPPYWIAIAVSIILSLVASRLVPGRPADSFSLGQVLAHLTYTQNILGFGNINSVFWTLCYEVQFYLVYAFLSLLKTKWALFCALLFSLLWSFRLAPDMPGWFPNLWFAFLLGTSAWLGWQYRVWTFVFFIYAAAILASAILFSDQFAIVSCLTALAIVSMAKMKMIATACDWRWLQFLGTISYSLYLLHNPITGTTFRAGKVLLGNSAISQAVCWGASIVFSICAAYCHSACNIDPLSRGIGVQN